MAYIPVINYEIDDVQMDDRYRRSIWLNTESRPILLPIGSEAEFSAALIILKKGSVIYDSETTQLVVG